MSKQGKKSSILPWVIAAAVLVVVLALALTIVPRMLGEALWNAVRDMIPEVTEEPVSDTGETEFEWPAGYLLSDPVPFTSVKRYEWADEAAQYPVLGSELLRGQIRSVTFLDTLADAPEDAWDVSAAWDGSVLAWATANGELYDLFIAAEGGVYATDSVNSLFAGFINTESICFGGCFHTENAADLSYLFLGCRSLTQVDVETLDTSAATALTGLFYDCNSLPQVDLSNLNTAAAKDLSAMFYDCGNLRTLDLSGFQTGAAENMALMFYGCKVLEDLDISSFVTDQVTDTSAMFYNCRCLDALDLSHFNTAAVTNMSNMFYGCTELRTLEVSAFDTAAVTNMSGMFYRCYELKELDVSGFNTAAVTDMSAMFCGCSNLKSLDLGSFDTGKVTNVSSMFYDCGAVTKKEHVDHLDFSAVESYDTFMNGSINSMREYNDWELLFINR